MKKYLWPLIFCATCFGQQITTVSSSAPTNVNVTLYSRYANYTLYRGTPPVWGYLNEGGYVEYKLQAQAGAYSLQLYFSNGTTTSGRANVSVNGVSQPAVSVPSTSSWGNFRFSPADKITLPSGTSTLRISATYPVQAFNLEGVLIKPVVPPTTSTPTAVKFFVDPYGPAAQNVNQSCSNGASISKLAQQPGGSWFGDWNQNPQADVAAVMSRAAAQGAVPTLIAYNIVNRDCGSYSSGGAANASAYEAWIQQFALGIGNAKAMVILEPDALPEISIPGCLTSTQQNERYSLLQYAESMLQQHAPNALVYLDAGVTGYVDVNTMADRLEYAGVGHIKGFALNISNYETTANNVTYGNQISALVGGKHFVIDTSRNGLGPTADHQWCNPPGRGAGSPSKWVGSGSVDAYLWVQNPGMSDGTCNGGPPAGNFSVPIACVLSKNAIF
jgi:endoglucanase